MICFYHAADFDGLCSGAIVYHKEKKICVMKGYNWEKQIDADLLDKHNKIYIVDVTLLDSYEKQLDYIYKNIKNGDVKVIWIDHHKSIFEKIKDVYESLDDYEIYPHGMDHKYDNLSACEMTWKILYPKKEMPLVVNLIGRYDVWDHSDPNVLNFQYGLKCYKISEPWDKIWERLIFKQDIDLIKEIIDRGKIVTEYIETIKINEAKKMFETNVTIPLKNENNKYESITYKAICSNFDYIGSKIFDNVYNEMKYDIMITFERDKGAWVLSFYSTKKEIDCSKIAEYYGGGGHKGAAGCSLNVLPQFLERDNK